MFAFESMSVGNINAQHIEEINIWSTIKNITDHNNNYIVCTYLIPATQLQSENVY